MTFNRRAVLASFALASTSFSRRAHTSDLTHASFTKVSAPDPISRHILSERIIDLNCGARTREEFPIAFDRGFPQLIGAMQSVYRP